ncbi:MAG: carbohydrate binding family 9 domain-containing protein [Bacteroidales bacterium]|nr:carbohydrate binding family 9 domain-containing protein [Bacteroidales bacterium]
MLYDTRSNIENNLGRRDEYNRADWFMVSLDSYYSGRTAFTFAVNAAGVQLDGQQDDNRRVSSGEINPLLPAGLDVSWDAIWYSAVNITDEGWSVEMRIPYNMLRYSRKEIQTWGVYFSRRIPKSGEFSEWPYIPRNQRNNLVSGYGKITGIKGIDPRPNIQVRPYVLGALNVFENENIPGKADHSFRVNAGGDIKLGIGPNVILDATIRPDFGQVEADPAVLNLTAFQTLFPEKRPFFLEGADIFKFGIGYSRLYYSRRFGADEPIIAAMKLSGRTNKDLSFGLMGVTAGDDFNPTNNYAVFRASQRIKEFSSAGGILTYYFSPAGKGSGWQSLTGGVDWDIRFNDNKYGFEGILAFSDRFSTDPDAEEQKGMMSSLVLRKRQGVVDGHLAFLMFTDQYNPNDIGWITSEQNWYQIWAIVKYKLAKGKEFGSFQRGELGMSYERWLSILEHYDMGSKTNLKITLTTKEFRQIMASATLFDPLGGYDLWETRGLWVWAKPQGS